MMSPLPVRLLTIVVLSKPIFRMHRIVLTACLSTCAFVAQAQQADPIVMRVGDHNVTRSELEYNFNKNNSEDVLDAKALEEYVPMFIDYRLKVQAALDARMDTLSTYQAEFRMYRDQQILPLLVTDIDREQETKAYYQQMLDALNGKDLRLPAHIFLRVSQNDSQEQQDKQKARIDSLYKVLQEGGDFAETAQKFSEDPRTAARGGELMWCGPGQLIPDFESVMYKLEKGQVSEPFLSSVGYHIVRLNDVKPLEPYDTLRPQILNYLESRGLNERLAKASVDSMARQQGISPEDLMDQESERLCAQDNDLKYLVQEYHDGLLLYEYCKTHIWDPAERDSAGMEQFFKKNKKRYKWDTPHFYGMLYYTRQSGDVKAVKKLLKRVDEKDWTSEVRRQMNADSVTVRMEQRLFVKGENASVDSLVFGVKQGKTAPRADYPYTGVVGRKLKKGPKRMVEVASQVKNDYRAACEEKAVKELREKYVVEVYDDVLKTVNNH